MRHLAPGSVVLDAGAGLQPYKALFSHCAYQSADFKKVDKSYVEPTYICDLASIPVSDNYFDAILFNQVMEHLPEPNDVLKEFRRILKPGGRILCTAPFFYEEHEQPYDFFRYTQFAWKYLMIKNGFDIERLDWLEGYLGTLGYQLTTAAKALPVKREELGVGILSVIGLLIILVCRFLFRWIGAVFYLLDSNHRYTNGGYPKNYLVIAIKQ